MIPTIVPVEYSNLKESWWGSWVPIIIVISFVVILISIATIIIYMEKQDKKMIEHSTIPGIVHTSNCVVTMVKGANGPTIVVQYATTNEILAIINTYK
jgi:hypothetical protein